MLENNITLINSLKKQYEIIDFKKNNNNNLTIEHYKELKKIRLSIKENSFCYEVVICYLKEKNLKINEVSLKLFQEWFKEKEEQKLIVLAN